MVAHEKRNSAQLFCAVPTRNDLALSSLLFPAQPTQKLEYPKKLSLAIWRGREFRACGRGGAMWASPPTKRPPENCT